MGETGFKLKNMSDIFAPTDPERKKGTMLYEIPLDKLFPLEGHRFKLYSGQRFTDLVESIITHGIYLPIIVRPIDDFSYEIISGHNRVEAAKTAGLETIPAIIREELTQEETHFIASETNLLQRSFSDMAHSERAYAISMHYNAVKSQGKRTDLIVEIENMVNSSNINELETCSPMGNKLKTAEKLGQEYGLSKNTIARYLRVEKLLPTHKERLDNGDFAIRAAVSLSYLTDHEQQIIAEMLSSSHYKLDIKKPMPYALRQKERSWTRLR